MFVYIRHGDDEESKYRYDEKLSDRGKKRARHRARDMIRHHGLPTHIYYSPMERTRKTAKQFMRVARKEATKRGTSTPQFVMEPRLGRYFTQKERHYVDRHTSHAMRRSTASKAMIDHGGKRAFRQRVEGHWGQLKDKHGDADRIWCVTHSLVFLHMARINSVDRGSHVSFLDTLVLNKSARSAPSGPVVGPPLGAAG